MGDWFVRDTFIRILMMAENMLHQMHDGADITTLGSGFGELDSDTEIKADKLIGTMFLSELSKAFPEARIMVEGQPAHHPPHGKPTCLITGDPLDGSLNYRLKGLTYGLPYSGVLTYLDTAVNPKFKDIRVAAIMDYRSRDTWLAYDYGTLFAPGGGLFLDEPIVTDQTATLDLRKQVVIAENYYPDNRALVVKLFEGETGWLRSIGSAAYEMACVATGQAAAFICNQQKQHEGGAGWLIVRSAGGIVTDWNGVSLDEIPYVFDAKTPMVMAANESVHQEMLARIKGLR